MVLLSEKTLKFLRKQVRKDLKPMYRAMVEYHLKKSKGEEKMSESKIKELKMWLKEMVNPYKPSSFIYDVQGSNQPNKEQEWVFNLYTDKNLYRITAIDRFNEEGYLGCTFSRRKPEVGESWTRGGDLPDGPFIKETWDKIKNSIIRNELIELKTEIVKDNEEHLKCEGCDKSGGCEKGSSAVFSIMSD